MAKLTVARALTARVARRIIRIATIAAVALFGIIFLGTWALAHFFSAWWWLLIIPFIVLLGLFLIIRLVVVLLIGRVHAGTMTEVQREGLDAFIDKLQAVAEARATPWPVMVAVCVKDLIFHRDVTTAKRLISDTAGLRRDYKDLEKLFD